MVGLFSKSPEEKAEKLRQKGHNCFDSKNFTEAVMGYDKALELDPNIVSRFMIKLKIK